jgi:hypothetical protein
MNLAINIIELTQAMWLLMRLLIFGLKNKSNIFYLIFGVYK